MTTTWRPVDTIDIWRSAKLLVGQHDAEAPIHAPVRADELLECGDVNGQRIWLAIKRAIETLLADKVPDNISMH